MRSHPRGRGSSAHGTTSHTANGSQMREHLRMLNASPDARQKLASFGLQTILKRHTCAHRVQELLTICGSLDTARPPKVSPLKMAGVSA